MILDSKGRPMRRVLGFVGGMEPEHEKCDPLVSAIGWKEPEVDEWGIEQCSEKPK